MKKFFVFCLGILIVTYYVNCSKTNQFSQKNIPITTTPPSLLLSFLQNNPPYGKSYALVIGINRYPNMSTKDQLDKATTDAKRFKNYLKDYAKFDNVTVLLDTSATLERIREELQYFFNLLKKNDRFVFYFSGHGQTVGGNSYLITTKGTKKDLWLHGLDIKDLARDFYKLSKTKHVLMILDACYSGVRKEPKATEIINEERLKRYLERRFVGIISAARSDEEAIEDPESNHGLFTRFLLEGLITGRADINQDNIITCSELYDYVEPLVIDKANYFEIKQTPQYDRIFGDGRFIFFKMPNRTQKENLALFEYHSDNVGKESSNILELLNDLLAEKFNIITGKALSKSSSKIDEKEAYEIVDSLKQQLRIDKIIYSSVNMIDNNIIVTLKLRDSITGESKIEIKVCKPSSLEKDIKELIYKLTRNE